MVKICAWVGLGMGLFSFLIYPFLIGKEQEPYSPTDYLLNVAGCLLLVVLSGHALGWW